MDGSGRVESSRVESSLGEKEKKRKDFARDCYGESFGPKKMKLDDDGMDAFTCTAQHCT
jgi:hypothetical protein